MDDTPYIHDGADASLRKTVSLLNKIEAKTGSTTITGPVTVSNEVEVTNSTGNPIPVSGTVTANTGLTQPLTDAQLRATAVPVNENLIVNQGSLFLYSTTGTYGAFDCGADADYVVFNRAGGGGGFTQKLEFSATSDFATAYDTLSSSFAIFSEKFITNTGNLSSQEPTNTLLASNESGSFVVNLRRLATYGGNENLKVRYVRLVVSGGGGGGFSGKFTSFRSKTSDAFNMNAAPHRTLISGTVDINSAKRPLPVTDNDGSLTVDGTVELGATSLAALENISVTFPATQNVNVTNAGLSVSVSNLPATQPVSGSVSVSNFPATQPVSLATAPTTPVTGTFWQATQPVSLASVPSHPVTGPLTNTELRSVAVPVSLASAPVTPVTDNGGSLTVDGTVTVNDMTSGNAKTKIVDSTGADVSYIPAGTAGTPSSSVLSVQGISGGTVIGINSSHVGDGIQAYLNDHGNDIPVSNQSITNIDADLGATTDSAATTDTGTFSAIALIKRGLQNWTTLLARIPALVSGRIPVEAAQATNANLKAQAQLLNSAGSLITYAESGTYGSPSVDVISVQNPQGTSAAIATFTSTTASTSLVSAATARKTLTVYNSGPGDLNISPTATCTTTNFQIRLASNDYWECPDQQVTMAHTAVFSSAGTAYVTTIS